MSVVGYVCVNHAHLDCGSRRGAGGLSIHEGAWAYCDGFANDDAHDWSATGGRALAELIRWNQARVHDALAPITPAQPSIRRGSARVA